MSGTLGKASAASSGAGQAIRPVSKAGPQSLSSNLYSIADSISSGLFFDAPMFKDSSGSIQADSSNFIGRIVGAAANGAWLSTGINNNFALATTTNAITQNALINETVEEAQEEGAERTVETEDPSEAKNELKENGFDVRHVNGTAGPGEKPAGGDGSGSTSEEAIIDTLGDKINAEMAEKLSDTVMVFADGVDGAAGWFSSNMAITLSKNGSMSTMFHEVGHALQHKLGGGLGKVRNGAEGGWGDAKMNAHMDTIREKMVANNFQMGELSGHYGWSNKNNNGAHDQSEEYAEAFAMWATQREEFETQFGTEIAEDFDEFFGKESENYDKNEDTQKKDPTTVPLFQLYNPTALRLMFGIGPKQIWMGPKLTPQFVAPGVQPPGNIKL